jgi:hypothetical protein
MSLGNTFENDLLALIFNATAIANLADNAATAPLTQIAFALHTADPGEAGNMSTSEAAYASYARVNVNRNTGGFPAPSGGAISPAANITFPASTGAGSTITHASCGPTGGGATKIFFSGTVTPNIAIGAAGITPQLTTASTITLD